MEISLSPDAVLLTCAAFGYKQTPAVMASSQHIVMNLAELKANPVTIKGGKYRASDQTSFLALADKADRMTEDIPITLSTNCLACQGVGEVHSYVGECVKVCPACQGQHRKHTYKEGCKKFGEQEPKAEQPAEAPAPAASSSKSAPEPSGKNNNPGITRKRVTGDKEKEERTVTRKRAALGDPDLPIGSSGVNKGSSSSSSSAHPEPQVEEVVPPVPEAEPPVPPDPQEDDVKRSLRKNS